MEYLDAIRGKHRTFPVIIVVVRVTLSKYLQGSCPTVVGYCTSPIIPTPPDPVSGDLSSSPQHIPASGGGRRCVAVLYVSAVADKAPPSERLLPYFSVARFSST